MDVRADGGHWSWACSAGIRLDAWRSGLTADRHWLAATSSDCIKGVVGWRAGTGIRERTELENGGTGKGRKSHIEEETYLTLTASESY